MADLLIADDADGDQTIWELPGGPFGATALLRECDLPPAARRLWPMILDCVADSATQSRPTREDATMQRTTQANVDTWADGFGVWHARVHYDRNPMAAAQVAIWREIESRQGQPAPVPAVVQDENDPAVWHEAI